MRIASSALLSLVQFLIFSIYLFIIKSR